MIDFIIYVFIGFIYILLYLAVAAFLISLFYYFPLGILGFIIIITLYGIGRMICD